jgi:GTP-binding protein
MADFDAINAELEKFDPEVARRPQVVALSKADVTEVREAYPQLKKRFARRRVPLRLVSAATGEGVRELLVELYRLVRGGEPA